MKYIQNVHIANVQCEFTIDGDLDEDTGLPRKNVITFKPASVDRHNNRQGETGYTTIEDGHYAALVKQSKVFTYMAKKNLLVVHDELPAEAQTPTDMLIQARTTIQTQAARIVELEAQVKSKGGKALEEANGKIEALELSLRAGVDTYNALEKLVAVIDPAVVEAAKAKIVGDGPQF